MLQLLGWERGYENGQDLLADLQAQPELETLLKEARANHIAINILDSLTGGFDGESSSRFLTDHINIRGMTKAKERGALIFELTNLASREPFERIRANLRLGGVYDTAESYARAKEEVEFRGVRRTVALEKAINSRMSHEWVQSCFSFIPARVIEEADFEAYYTHYLDEDHKEYYRAEWRKKMKIAEPGRFGGMVKTVSIGLLAIGVLRIFYY